MSAITKDSPAAAIRGGQTPRPPRSGPVRLIAASLAAGLAVTGFALAGATSAGAVEPLRAQSVGRLVDGSLGGNPIQQVADVADARATAPGTQSVQNPLDVTLLGQINVPLTGVINFPTDPAIVAGAANQVAVAHLDGFSYGAAGAVSNSGGANLGGSNDSFPAFGTINLTGAAIPGLPGLPGAGELPSLGAITASIGAVAALAQTKSGGAVTPAPQYVIAGLNLTLSSPALGGVLSQIGDALSKPPTLPALPGLPTECSFNAQVLSNLTLLGGAVTINPTNGLITISLAKLLAQLGLNINALPANTDLIAYLLDYLTRPSGLAAGLQQAIAGVTDPLQDKFSACGTALAAKFPPPLDVATQAFFDALAQGKTMFTTLVNSIIAPLAAAGGVNPLKPLADGLKAVIDIGINVESGPGIQPEQSNPDFKFTTKLDKTPNQATPVVANQTLIRALEVNVLGGVPAAGNFVSSLAAPSAGLATIALANAAVGPSSAAPAAPTTSTSTVPPGPTNTNIPTGVPAGFAKPASPLDVPLILLIVGLFMASGGAVAWKLRGRHAR
ncbi:MAG: choice-of-anchor G family protein [Pseudonocardiales bacterium]